MLVSIYIHFRSQVRRLVKMIISDEKSAKNAIIDLLGNVKKVSIGVEAITMDEYIRISKNPNGILITECDDYSKIVMIELFSMDFDECKQFVDSKIREGFMGNNKSFQTVLVRINENNCGNLIITQLESIGDIFGKSKLIQSSYKIAEFINSHPEILFKNWNDEIEVNDNIEIQMNQEEFFCLMGIDY